MLFRQDGARTTDCSDDVSGQSPTLLCRSRVCSPSKESMIGLRRLGGFGGKVGVTYISNSQALRSTGIACL